MLESRGKHNSWGIWARLRLEYMVQNPLKLKNGLHAKNGFPETSTSCMATFANQYYMTIVLDNSNS